MVERISLAEAYNNKDVITQIAILKDKLDSIPDADLTNVVLKTGDQIIDGEKTFNDPIVANGGVVFANSGIHVNGTLEVDGDIIQNGSAYETHAEQVFTKNDLIVTREDAIGGIAAGQLSGIRVKKYDGVSDLNLGVDSGGIMRVGDLGDEQPLMTRDESADLTDGAILKWDAANAKAVNEGSVGDDAHPIKIVNGVAMPITNGLTFSHFNYGSTRLTNNDTDYNVTLNQNSVINLNPDLITRSNNEFTARVNGVITFSFNGYLSSSSSTRLGVSIYLNNSRYDTFSAYCTQDSGVCLSDSLYLSAGDKIKFMIRALNSNNVCGGGNLSVIFRAL